MASKKKAEEQAAPRGPELVPLVAWSLVRRKGGIAPVRFELSVSRDLSVVEVDRAELGTEDYRAITEAKVKHFMSSHTPEWA